MSTDLMREPRRLIFTEPANLTEAEDARAKLVEEIASIEHQLAARRSDDQSIDDHLEWRHKATHALRVRQGILHRVDGWIAGHDPDAHALMRDVCALLETLKDDDVEFEPNELETLERLRAYVDGRRED